MTTINPDTFKDLSDTEFHEQFGDSGYLKWDSDPSRRVSREEVERQMAETTLLTVLKIGKESS